MSTKSANVITTNASEELSIMKELSTYTYNIKKNRDFQIHELQLNKH